MNQKQQNRLSMYKAVADHLKANDGLWKTFVPFAIAAGGLSNTIHSLDKALQQQAATASAGATADKNNLGLDAVKLVLVLARNTAAYAMTSSNMELYTQLDRPRTYLERLPDNEQVATLQAMLDKIQAHAANLKDYKVDKQKIADAQAAVNAAAAALARPRTVIDAHSTATGNIPALQSQARLHLGVLDKLIYNFTDEAPDFVSNYHQARIVVDSGIRHEDTPEEQEGDGVEE